MSDIMEEDIDIEVVDTEVEAQKALEEPQFPIFSSREVEDRFKNYLAEELDTAYWERSTRFAKLRTWRRMADNENTSGREPAWEGASNVNVPVIPILLKTASARLRNVFNARKPFWSISALNQEADSPWIKKTEVLERYYNMISMSKYDLNLYAKNNKIMTDLPIAGTVWVKVPWTHLERNITSEGFDVDGNSTGDVTEKQVIHDGPEFIPVRVEDVFFRESFQDVQSAPWIAIQNPMSWYEVSLWDNNGYWKNVEDIKDSGRTGFDVRNEYEVVDQDMRDVHAQFTNKESSWMWDIMEFWVYYDSNDDGIYEDLVAYYHRKTNTLLSVEYNRLGERPVRNVPFYLRPHSMEGQAVPELSADLQEEINALHNMRNDGIHLTESAQYAVKRGSGVRPKEKVKPGKVWFLDDPNTDIKLLQNSKSYVETANLETLDYSYLERVTGIQDIAGGFSSMMLKSRDTASSQGLRMSAGSEVFQGIIEGVDLAYQDLAEMLFRQLVANKDRVIAKEREAQRLSPEDITILEDILDVDVNAVPYVLAFKARLVEEADTYDGKRQSLLTLVTIYQQYVTQIIPLIVQTYQGQPQILQTFMQKFVEGATHLMQDIFKFFGQEDVNDYMITADKITSLNGILSQMQGQLGQIGQGPGGDANGQGGAQTGMAGGAGPAGGGLGTGNPAGGVAGPPMLG